MKTYFQLLRLYQWPKNAFVFTGILFSHSWQDISMLIHVSTIAFAFCLISSSVYIFNDILDQKSDENHPVKKFRPIPSGKVSSTHAALLSLVLFGVSLFIAWTISNAAAVVLMVYGGINLLYSVRLKQIVILDVFCIAFGFMLRILAGTLGADIPPSSWLLLCGLLLTLFLGFTKRRAEMIAVAKSQEGKSRESLQKYSPLFLDQIISVCAGGVILTYSLYTMSSATVALHQTEALIYTVPFVSYALFRYLFLLYQRQMGEDPAWDLARDWHMLSAMALWLIATLVILH